MLTVGTRSWKFSHGGQGVGGWVRTQLQTPADCLNFHICWMFVNSKFYDTIFVCLHHQAMPVDYDGLLYTFGLIMFCYPLLILSILFIYIVICSFILIGIYLLYTHLFEMESITIADHFITWTLQNSEAYFLLEGTEERKILCSWYVHKCMLQVFTQRPEENARCLTQVSCSITLHLVLLRQGLSLNQELGPVSTCHGVDVTMAHCYNQLLRRMLGILSQVLMLTQ